MEPAALALKEKRNRRLVYMYIHADASSYSRVLRAHLYIRTSSRSSSNWLCGIAYIQSSPSLSLPFEMWKYIFAFLFLFFVFSFFLSLHILSLILFPFVVAIHSRYINGRVRSRRPAIRSRPSSSYTVKSSSYPACNFPTWMSENGRQTSKRCWAAVM